ncbi:MAG: hypothetical protein OEZ22_04740 [Spirochaetia bacterium]|nr:hypothetical protein [Spirochaetia bacterium]
MKKRVFFIFTLFFFIGSQTAAVNIAHCDMYKKIKIEVKEKKTSCHENENDKALKITEKCGLNCNCTISQTKTNDIFTSNEIKLSLKKVKAAKTAEIFFSKNNKTKQFHEQKQIYILSSREQPLYIKLNSLII